jgi:hypothetical protein
LVSGPNEIDLRLYTDGGGMPGVDLDTIHASNQMPMFATTSTQLITFTSTLHPTLLAGETYWLLPFADEGTLAVWNVNNQGQIGPIAQSFNEPIPGDWNVFTDDQGAFEVNGSPVVPEPSTLALLALGTVGLFGYGWGRRK